MVRLGFRVPASGGPTRVNKKALRPAKERMYAIIDHATSETLSAPNFALYTDVAAAITGSAEPQYMANKACKQLRKRLQCRKGHAQALALQLLEHCVRTCGDAFHIELAHSDLLGELVRLSDRSAWCPPEVSQQTLALLQEWAYTLRPSPFVNTYNKLKARGMVFPPRTGDAGAGFQPYPGLSPGPPALTPGGGPMPGPFGPAPVGGPLSASAAQTPGSRPTNPAADLFGAGSVPPGTPGSAPARGSALLSPDQPPAKIAADLEVARNTVDLLVEVLSGVEAGDDPAGVKEDYISDMAEQARAMLARLAGLVERIEDENLLSSALALHDDAQRALDRHARLVDIAEGRSPPPPRRAAAHLHQGIGGVVGAGVGGPGPAASVQVPAPVPPPHVPQSAPPLRPQPVVADLLSLDDWTPEVPSPAVPLSWQKPFGTQAAPVEPAATVPQQPPQQQVVKSNNPFADPGSFPAAAPQAPPAAVPASVPAYAAGPSAGNAFFSDDAWGSAAAAAGGLPASGTVTGLIPASAPAPSATSIPAATSPSSTASSSHRPQPPAVAAGFGEAAPSTAWPPAQPVAQSSNPFAAGGASAAPAAPAPAPAPPTGNNPFASGDAFSFDGIPAAAPSPQAAFPTVAPLPQPAPFPAAATGSLYPALYEAPAASYDSYGAGSSNGAGPSAAAVAPLSDAFQGLVTLRKKEEDLPPPPKGSPMRRTGGSSAAPPPAEQQQSEGLDAFAAFDAIASPKI